jgi:hypothetical protein
MSRIARPCSRSPVSAPASCPPPRQARRRCCRWWTSPSSSMRWRRRSRPGSPTSSSSPGAPSARSRTTSTRRSNSSSSSRRAGKASCSSAGALDAARHGVRASTSARPSRWGSAMRCCARARSVGDEPFAVMLPDDLIDHEAKGRGADGRAFDRTGASVLAVRGGAAERPTSTASSAWTTPRERSERMVTASSRSRRPSGRRRRWRWSAATSSPRPSSIIWSAPRAAPAARSSSPTRSRSCCQMRRPGRRVPLPGQRFDCGNKLGFLEATVEYALKHPELKDAFRAYLSANAPG